MTTDRKELDEAELDRLLDRMAEEQPPEASEALMARVLADALAELPPPGGVRARPSGGVLRGLFAAIGGWAGTGGLVTAGLVGLWFGIAPPTAVKTEAQTLWNTISPDLTGGWADYGDSL